MIPVQDQALQLYHKDVQADIAGASLWVTTEKVMPCILSANTVVDIADFADV